MTMFCVDDLIYSRFTYKDITVFNARFSKPSYILDVVVSKVSKIKINKTETCFILVPLFQAREHIPVMIVFLWVPCGTHPGI